MEQKAENIPVTTLPYRLVELEYMRKNPHIIKIVNCELENDKILIHLRNTQYPGCVLNFEGMHPSTLANLLGKYLTSDLQFAQPQLLTLTLDLLKHSMNIPVEDKDNAMFCHLIYDEMKDLVGEINTFLFSTVCCAVKRFKLEGLTVIDDIDKINESSFGRNIYYILRHPDFEKYYYILSDSNIKVYDYPSHFYMENNELFDAVQQLPFMSLLQGFAEQPVEAFKALSNLDEMEVKL